MLLLCKAQKVQSWTVSHKISPTSCAGKDISGREVASVRLFLKAAGGCAAENRSVSLSPSHRNINAGYGVVGKACKSACREHITLHLELKCFLCLLGKKCQRLLSEAIITVWSSILSIRCAASYSAFKSLSAQMDFTELCWKPFISVSFSLIWNNSFWKVFSESE